MGVKTIAKLSDVEPDTGWRDVSLVAKCRTEVAMSQCENKSQDCSVVVVPSGAAFAVKVGFYEGLEVAIDRDWVVIGRGRSADVVFAEPTISRAHAAIGYDADGFYVQDLGSTNGTLVNGAKADRQLLKGGDEIRMGRLIIGLELPPA